MRPRGLVIALLTAAACGTGAGSASLPTAPTLLAAIPAQLTVGQNVTFVGADFFPDSSVRTDIELNGTFTGSDGVQEPVAHLRLRPHRQDANTLVLTNFGPFANPLAGDGARIGTFSGAAVAVNTPEDGSSAGEVVSAPLPLTITVAPSIVVKSLQPLFNADCPGPAKRVLGAIPYVIELAAAGFEPVNFTLAISGEPGGDSSTTIPQPRIYRVPAKGHGARFGDGDLFLLFEPVPTDLAFYAANLEISALGKDGQTYASRYAFGVHNAIEYITTGSAEVAEVYQPQSVSDCFGGGINGSTQTWTESREESQQRQVGTTWDQSWVMGHSQSTAKSETNGVTLAVADDSSDSWTAGWNSSLSNTNEVSDTNSWNWGVHADASTSVTVGASAQVNLGVAQIGANASATDTISVGTEFGVSGSHTVVNSVTGSYGKSFDRSHSDSHSSTVGHDYSVNDTETWSYEQSQTVAKGGSEFWTVSTATTNTHSTEVSVLPGQQAMVYRQRVRLKYPAIIVRYDLCGEPEVVAQAGFTDWKWSIAVEQGGACPPPPTHLAPAQCFIDCGGH
jgi:hypothetical protein